MISFISPTASSYLKQVEQTLLQQEEMLTEGEKLIHPFWKRTINAVLQTYHSNKIKVISVTFIAIDYGYSLTVNKETVSFLEKPEIKSSHKNP